MSPDITKHHPFAMINISSLNDHGLMLILGHLSGAHLSQVPEVREGRTFQDQLGQIRPFEGVKFTILGDNLISLRAIILNGHEERKTEAKRKERARRRHLYLACHNAV